MNANFGSNIDLRKIDFLSAEKISESSRFVNKYMPFTLVIAYHHISILHVIQIIIASSNHSYKISTFVMRPFCLVESCTLDAPTMRVRSLFSSFTFWTIIFSCPLISKERIHVVPFTWVSLIEIPATINLYYTTTFVILSAFI